MLNTREVKRTRRRMLLQYLYLANEGNQEALETVKKMGNSIKDCVKTAIEVTNPDGETFIEFGKRETMSRCHIGRETLENALKHGWKDSKGRKYKLWQKTFSTCKSKSKEHPYKKIRSIAKRHGYTSLTKFKKRDNDKYEATTRNASIRLLINIQTNQVWEWNPMTKTLEECKAR